MRSIAVAQPGQSVYPLVLMPDRFGGAHSGGTWHAWPVASTKQIPAGIYAAESASKQFWAVQEAASAPMVGTGHTTDQAIGDLRVSLRSAGRTLPGPTPPKEIKGLRPYLGDDGLTIQAAKRLLRCAAGLDGSDYRELADALSEIEETVGTMGKSVHTGDGSPSI